MLEKDEEFIGEPITPEPGSASLTDILSGAPGIPMRFTWRNKQHAVTQIIKRWKTTGPCRHGSGERYIRKHWFEILTDQGTIMKLYCDRQPRRGHPPAQRWWLYTIRRGN